MSSQSDYDAIVIGSGMGGLVFASTTRGIIKMVADDRTEEVLGVSMVGTNAGEVIHEAAMGLRFRARSAILLIFCTSIRPWPKRSRSSPYRVSRTQRNFHAAPSEPTRPSPLEMKRSAQFPAPSGL